MRVEVPALPVFLVQYIADAPLMLLLQNFEFKPTFLCIESLLIMAICTSTLSRLDFPQVDDLFPGVQRRKQVFRALSSTDHELESGYCPIHNSVSLRINQK